jgi:hypothetical protein
MEKLTEKKEKKVQRTAGTDYGLCLDWERIRGELKPAINKLLLEYLPGDTTIRLVEQISRGMFDTIAGLWEDSGIEER